MNNNNITPTPTEATLQANMLHAAYRMAHHDHDFLGREDMRGTRIMLEYQKTESALKDMNIQSALVVFGSARVMSPEQAEQASASAKTDEEKAMAKLRRKQVAWYETSREFGKIVSLRGGAIAPALSARHNVIATGGGPGLMEAANRGAHEAGAPSIGFNITLEHEQVPNMYSTPELTFLFKFFGIRKMHMALRSTGLAVMPGGFGTMDEMYDNGNMTIH